MSYLNLIRRYPVLGWIALWGAFAVPLLVSARLGYLWLGVGLGAVAASLLLSVHRRLGKPLRSSTTPK